MYPNLKAEIARQNLTLDVISKKMDIAIGTLSQKLNGKYPITLAEAKRLKAIVKADIPLEELFESREEVI